MATGHPYRVCGVGRATWHGLVAASLPELRQKGCVKLSLNAAPDKVEVVLEEDGTIVDDDDYLQLLDKNSQLMLLQPGERWDRRRVDDEVETDGRPLSQSEKVARMLHRDLGLIINLSDLQLRAVAEEQPEVLASWLGGEEAAELVSGACGRVLDSRQQLQDVHSFVALYRRAEDHDRQLRRGCSREVAAANDVVTDGRPPHPPPVVHPGPAEGDRRPGLRPPDTLDAALLGQLAGGLTAELGLSTEQLERVTEAGPDAVAQGLGVSPQDAVPIVLACWRERESRCQQLLGLGRVRRSNPGPVNPGPVNPGPVDPGPVDTGPVDTGPVDTGVPTSRSSVDVKGNRFLPLVVLLSRIVARRPTEPGLSMNELKRVMRDKKAVARHLGLSNSDAHIIMRACMREKNSRHQRLLCLEHIRSNPSPVDPGPVDTGPVDPCPVEPASCSSVNVEYDWWRRLRPSGALTVALLGRLVDRRPTEPGLSMVELEQVIAAGVAAMAQGLGVSESDADNVLKTCQHERDSRSERMSLLNYSRLSIPILSHRSVPLVPDAKSGLQVRKRRQVMDQGSGGRPGEQQKEQEEEGPDCVIISSTSSIS